MVKQDLKQKAVTLRKQGKTYSEIMKVVPVAKSTISLWLREVGLSVAQRQNITDKRRQAQKRGADAQRNKRVKKQTSIIENAQAEIGKMTLRELWLVGIALYWAEGSKEKEYRTSSRASFSNSDPKMILLFLEWLNRCVRVPTKDIGLDLYIHESHKDNVDKVIEEWAQILNQPLSAFEHTYFKKNKIRTKRKNKGDLYIGLLRVNIRASTDLNRKIAGWISGITKYWGIV
jgi:hypothetical protein